MYKKLLQLIEFVENENSKCKYDTNKISKRIILKDILNKLHELYDKLQNKSKNKKPHKDNKCSKI